MNNSIHRVTLTIETASGDLHQLVVNQPGPLGDNPRFMGQQLAEAATELMWRADDLLATYAEQIPAESR